jgi:SAM-dependent methyltransferase
VTAPGGDSGPTPRSDSPGRPGAPTTAAPAEIAAQWEANAPGWIELSRAGFDVYRDLVNTPAFLALLPEVAGLRCLDIGCGEGHNTRLVAGRGASVVAVDLVWPFLVAAAAERARPVAYARADATSLPFVDATFDAVTAFMSIMDVADPEGALVEVFRVLRPGGFVQFSIGHPATTTPVRRWVTDEEGRRRALAVGDYFSQGVLTESWTFGEAPAELRERHPPFMVSSARRTLSGWLNAVIAAGFVIEAVAEPYADPVTAAAHPEVADTAIVPYFLIVRARRQD